MFCTDIYKSCVNNTANITRLVVLPYLAIVTYGGFRPTKLNQPNMYNTPPIGLRLKNSTYMLI